MKFAKKILALVLVLALTAVMAGCSAAGATGSADGASTTGSLFSMIATFGVMIVLFYVLLIRPENKRKKQVNEMRAGLAVGDQITTIGGVVGVVCAVKDDKIVVETSADRVRVEFAKWAISSNDTANEAAKAAAAQENVTAGEIQYVVDFRRV